MSTASNSQSGPDSNNGGPYIVSLDIGSSSVRALLFDTGARPMEGYGAQLPYRLITTPDGGAGIDPIELAELAIDCLDEIHRQVDADGLPVAAITGSAFWHSFLGVNAEGQPTLALRHLLDTRSASYLSQLPDLHARTGCMPHTSYWPAALLWLRDHRGDGFRAACRWVSFPEYLFELLTGTPALSTSMVSATGLWDQNKGDYDDEMLAALPIQREQLADPATLDRPATELLPEYARMWPSFAAATWYPLLGDGAANNLGSGCISSDRVSLMVGTTGAMRIVIEADSVRIPDKMWCYRVDSRRFVLGGAISNGGEVYAWAKRTLQLPRNIEELLDSATPGDHGLIALPFFSGERTPYWRSDLRAAITGMNDSTGPLEILRALLESVALCFADVYDLLVEGSPDPIREIIASGGALLRSPAWTQMMADALGRPITASTEAEASCRGAALLALERLGIIDNLADLPASTGGVFEPRPAAQAAFAKLRQRRQHRFDQLYGGSPQAY